MENPSVETRLTPLLRKLKETIWTLLSADFWGTIRSDFNEILEFYLSPETKISLERSKDIPRFFRSIYYILREMYRRLSPARQVLLILSFLLFIFPTFRWSDQSLNITAENSALGFVVLLFLLLLELKDKLLAKDELQAGHKVQVSLMPKGLPQIPGWDIWLYTRPANDVGGDLIDHFRSSGLQHDIFLADVAGKGLGAALLTTKLQATLRALSPLSDGLSRLAQNANMIFCRDVAAGKFASLIIARVLEGGAALSLVNAGHLSPILKTQGSWKEVGTHAPALGLMPEAVFNSTRVSMKMGDYLILYSDGITDARDPIGNFFGEERLKRLVALSNPTSSEEFGKEIIRQIEFFMQDARLHDDISLAIIRRN